MVILDSTFLLHLLFDRVEASIDTATGEPVAKCKERIEHLLKNLSEARMQVLIPTPVLSEVLTQAGTRRAEVLAQVTGAYAFRIAPFDEMAAVECAELLGGDGKPAKKVKGAEAKAKVKFDRQIIAIAKVNGIKTIYSDDKGLASVGRANGITVIKLSEVQLPPEPPQRALDLVVPEADAEDDAAK